jgi:hypothetical protein
MSSKWKTSAYLERTTLPYVGYTRPKTSLAAILTCSNVDLANTEEISDG